MADYKRNPFICAVLGAFMMVAGCGGDEPKPVKKATIEETNPAENPSKNRQPSSEHKSRFRDHLEEVRKKKGYDPAEFYQRMKDKEAGYTPSNRDVAETYRKFKEQEREGRYPSAEQ